MLLYLREVVMDDGLDREFSGGLRFEDVCMHRLRRSTIWLASRTLLPGQLAL